MHFSLAAMLKYGIQNFQPAKKMIYGSWYCAKGESFMIGSKSQSGHKSERKKVNQTKAW